ncbi:MAG: hypothetical protein C5B51_05255 [Terriglobia bacterium]|nr:MAG: hypothetical protein C5B51_05255 [Terriglobia bacterium]
MELERLRQIETLFHVARELDKGRQADFLREACGADDALRAEVESLLGHQDEAQDFIESPAMEQAARALARDKDLTEAMTADGAASPSDRIDHYRVIRLLGQGGMGEVWLAEQEEPVRRRVALKLVKAGMNTREVIARFESERQALALMEHPAIAKVLDAGATPLGTPYFVMEYVAGVPITSYCDDRRLSTKERLELFVRVCEGVQHAHQKAIIHRDLKPSNILVTEVDGRPAPKIIDFGIAKALTQRLTEQTLFTRVGALVGTPEYMSPEQALSSGEDIDTRTDVYSLAIVLYEMLTGTPPIELRKIALDEFLRRLRREDPPKPSTRIRGGDRAALSETARNRRSEPGLLAKQLRGDLDAIVLKALEKDRGRRYGSAAELAADIGRHLRNEPVMAVAPSAAYRARKFAGRHRAALATAAAFALVLIAAAAISIAQSIRANRQAAVAQVVSDFLQNDLLAQASSTNQGGAGTRPDPHLEVRTALDRAAARIAGKFDRQPEVEAAIRDTMARTYMRLDLYAEARTQAERALELERRVLGPNQPKTLRTTAVLGYIVRSQGRYEESESLFRQALDRQRTALGPEHADTLYSMFGLANVYYREGKYEQAGALYSQLLEIQRRVLGPEHTNTLLSMNGLAIAYYLQAKYMQAEALDKQALEIQRRVLGPEHPNTLFSMNSLANDYAAQGRYAEAEPLFTQSLDIKRRVLGPEHSETVLTMTNLGNNLAESGKYAEAEKLLRQTLEIERRVLGPEHDDTLRCMDGLAQTYAWHAAYTSAQAIFSEALEKSRRVFGPEHPQTLTLMANSASAYQRQGQYTLAEMRAAQALGGRRRRLGGDHPDTIDAAGLLALTYVSEGKFEQAEPLAREALDFYRKKQPDDWQRFRAASLLGASLTGERKYAEAEPLLVGGYQGMLERKPRMGVPDEYHLDLAREWVTRLHQVWRPPETAAGPK